MFREEQKKTFEVQVSGDFQLHQTQVERKSFNLCSPFTSSNVGKNHYLPLNSSTFGSREKALAADYSLSLFLIKHSCFLLSHPLSSCKWLSFSSLSQQPKASFQMSENSLTLKFIFQDCKDYFTHLVP
jgi:hypothetical protein